MNFHILDKFANEKSVDIMRSIELFIGLFVVISIIGFVCLAVA